MSRCVIDASTTLAWLFNESGRGPALGKQFLSLELIAPWLWQLEIAHVILKRERQKVYTEAQANQRLQAVDDLGVEVVGSPQSLTLVGMARVARPHQLTSYDAAYFDLAMRLGLPLLSDDKNLRAAAERTGLQLIEPAGTAS